MLEIPKFDTVVTVWVGVHSVIILFLDSIDIVNVVVCTPVVFQQQYHVL